MKKSVYIVLLVLSAGMSFAETVQTVDSQITTVTVFSNQALIERQASVAVKKGFAEIRVPVETFAVDPDSVTARIFGKGEVLSVQFKEIPVAEQPQEKIRTLEATLTRLTSSRRELQDSKLVLKKQEAFLDAFIDFSQSQIPRDLATRLPKPDDLNQTLSFLRTGYRNVFEQLQALDSKRTQLDKEIQVVERELAALRGPDRRSLRVIELLFLSAADQNIRIEAHYITRSARWQPLYKVSVPATLAGVDLTMFSNITQKSGEDWKQVQLAVSNVVPLRGVRLPSLTSWLLDLPRPVAAQPRRSKVAMRETAPAADEIAVAGEAARPEEAEFVQAERTKLPLSFEYKMPRKIDIESRDKETLLPLLSKKMSGNFYHYCVPRRSPLTFLVADVKADKELLSGMLNVYFESQYVGKTFLQEKKPGEEFTLNLGADREVSVKREKTHDKVKETFLGKFERDNVVRELSYKITAENRKDSKVSLTILDSIPVSKTDRIEVTDVRITPEPDQKNHLDRQGVMRWDLQLKPEQKNEIVIEFTVTYPKEFPPRF